MKTIKLPDMTELPALARALEESAHTPGPCMSTHPTKFKDAQRRRRAKRRAEVAAGIRPSINARVECCLSREVIARENLRRRLGGAA